MRGETTPSKNWPIGRRIELLDAWLKNPIHVKVTRHTGEDTITAEDDRGIVYFAKTHRIVGFVDKPVRASEFDDFSDVLG